MDPARLAQLGRSALEYTVQHYLAKHHSITSQEVEILTKLVSGPTFLDSLGPATAEKFGQQCVEGGISGVQLHVERTVGPRISAFLALKEPAWQAPLGQDQTPLDQSVAAYDCTSASTAATIFASLDSMPTLDPNSASEPDLMETPSEDLFGSLSDEVLLKDSSFANSKPSRAPSSRQHSASEFDLLDSDSWYQK